MIKERNGWPILVWNGFEISVIHDDGHLITMAAHVPETPMSHRTAVFHAGYQILGTAANIHDAAMIVRDGLMPLVPRDKWSARIEFARKPHVILSKSIARRLTHQTGRPWSA